MPNKIRLIATLPPLVGHRRLIIDHPAVDELRLNTIMPISESQKAVLKRLKEEVGKKKLWLDLKTRQLRITQFSYLPYAFVRLSHKIQLDPPFPIHFKDGTATVVEVVDGNKLILSDRPDRIVGEGEPVNILDPWLKIKGFLTPGDREYIKAAKSLGMHSYMLSFTESQEDIEAVRAIDPEAEICAKIESLRGLDFVQHDYSALKGVRLMAARDDLYAQMPGGDKIKILKALKLIVNADPKAVVASKIFTSLENQKEASLGDISDVELMRRMGYRNFMLSDGVCFREKVFSEAAKIFQSWRTS
ncbi:MAG: hypothetical protein AAB345_03315 [Patescibacteria group bacterium]